MKNLRVAGIISEYNPFHNGHKHHIEQTKKMGATHVVAVMSGSAVQRGEFASMSKYVRAKSAILNGVDLVIELPALFSLRSAEQFALGGVTILNAMGCIDILSFGSECADIKRLDNVADFCESCENSSDIINELKKGVSYPRAMTAVAKNKLSDDAEILASPNDTLAVQYILALRKLNSTIIPTPILRIGAEHDTDIHTNGIASASYIRKNLPDFSDFLPKNSLSLLENAIQGGEHIISKERFELAMLSAIKMMSCDDWNNIPDVSEGLNNRLFKAGQQALSLEEFYHIVKTKRYTMSRIRRISLYALLKITKHDLTFSPEYMYILGANERGHEILAKMRKGSALPHYTSFTKAFRTRSRIAEIDKITSDMHAFLSKTPLPSGQDHLRQIESGHNSRDNLI